MDVLSHVESGENFCGLITSISNSLLKIFISLVYALLGFYVRWHR